MVRRYKSGRMTEEEYTSEYIELMRQSYRMNKGRWDTLMLSPVVTLLCYCQPYHFCHRLVLAELLVKMGGRYLGETKTPIESDTFQGRHNM